jgi:hypothetical protein
MLPLLPEASAHYFPWVADLALSSALYGGLLGLAQMDLRRMLGFVLTSQMGLVLVGVAEANRDSLHGALLQMLALGLTSTGLVLLTSQLEARAGTTDARELGGAASRFPFLAGAFFVIGIASIGFPGSLMFVSEDLLLHGLLGSHPRSCAASSSRSSGPRSARSASRSRTSRRESASWRSRSPPSSSPRASRRHRSCAHASSSSHASRERAPSTPARRTCSDPRDGR